METHNITRESRNNLFGPQFRAVCDCGEASPWLYSSGMVSGWSAEHDPRLREMEGILNA